MAHDDHTPEDATRPTPDAYTAAERAATIAHVRDMQDAMTAEMMYAASLRTARALLARMTRDEALTAPRFIALDMPKHGSPLLHATLAATDGLDDAFKALPGDAAGGGPATEAGPSSTDDDHGDRDDGPTETR